MSDPLNPAMFFAPIPSPQEKALWDKFVEEYMKDFNALEACLRIGFDHVFAVEFSKTLLVKPYVQQEIMKRKLDLGDIKEEDLIARDRALILATLREGAQSGQMATRVAAAKVLAGMHGLDQAPDKTGDAVSRLVEDLKTVAKHLPD